MEKSLSVKQIEMNLENISGQYATNHKDSSGTLEDSNTVHENFDSENMKPILTNQSSNKKLNCPICNYKAFCMCRYQSHIATHTDPLAKNLFKCFFCGQRLTTLLHLREHLFVHGDQSEKLKCFACNVFCKSEVDFKDHIWLHQSLGKQTFKCIYCDQETYSINTMKMHMLKHKNYIAVQECCLCHYKSKSRGDLLRHFVTHKVSPNSPVLKCSFCEYKVNHLSALKLHLSTHGDEIEVFKCCVCDYQCHSKIDLTKHFLIHKHRSKLGSFKCSLCDYTMSYLEEFRLHILKQHRSSDSSDFCMCQYNSQTTYNEEERGKQKQNKKGSTELTHQCEKCSYCFKSSADLKSHQENQNGCSNKKLFYCTSCNSTATTRSNLKQHILLHLNPEKYPLLRCEWCDFKTIHKAHLNKHIESNHIKRSEPEYESTQSKAKNTVYRCGQCSFKSEYLSCLIRHEDVHKDRSERELFNCEHCSSTFTSKKGLRKHSLLHTKLKEKPMFQCKACDFRTLFKNFLKPHFRKEHPEEVQLRFETIRSEKPPEEDLVLVNARDSNSALSEGERNDSESQHTWILNNTKTDTGTATTSDGEPWETMEYQCDQCSFHTKRPSQLITHQQIHKDRSERQLFNCTICGASFTSIYSLKTHNWLHMSPQERPVLRCNRCDYTTLKSFSLKKHYKSKHPEMSESEIESIFESRVKRIHLNRRENTPKSRSKKQYECTVCSSTFTTKKRLKEHVSSEHEEPNDEAMFRCFFCEFRTADDFEMNSHKLEHIENPTIYSDMEQIKTLEQTQKEEPSEEPLETEEGWIGHQMEPGITESVGEVGKYQCDKCPFHATKLSIYKCHQEVHKDRSERQLFPCTVCGATFTKKPSLKKHSLLHVDPEKRPTFQCVSCDYKTIYKCHIKSHFLSKHSKEKQVSDDTAYYTYMQPETSEKGGPSKYECDECSFQANHPSQLKRHKQVHRDRSERQLFACTDCDVSCTSKSALKRHTLTHADPDDSSVLSCDQCEYKTLYATYLQSHMKWKHAEQAQAKPKSKGKAGKVIRKCTECSYETTVLVRLRRHQEIHRDRSERQLYECETCSSTYTTKKSLKEHIESQHMDASNASMTRSDDCEFTTVDHNEKETHRLERTAGDYNFSEEKLDRREPSRGVPSDSEAL